jgi:N-hydroxyarylamine O-acetyltransferase
MSLALEAYLDRIGWAGDRTPNYETLAALVRKHMIAIPFENLDVLLGRPPRLDSESLQRKLVDNRRGGYCFEHVTLFKEALDALGFQTTRHSARVVLFSPREDSPRAHMFLTVSLPEGRYVVDPGFGGPAPVVPVALAQPSPGSDDATHWMAREGDNWILRTRRDGEPFDAWVSTLEPDHPVDFEMANHFMATHPSSPFVNMMMMSRFTEDGRITLMNRDFSVGGANTSETGQLADRQALRVLLRQRFGFDLPDVEQIAVPAIPEWR